MPILTTAQHEQLSRTKDKDKSSKKKDPTSGTASPSSQSTTLVGSDSRSPNNSNVGTPTSSSTNVSDVRSRAPPAETGSLQANHAPQGLSNATPTAHRFMPQPPNPIQQSGIDGLGTPGRPGHLAPTVVISPSAPVSKYLILAESF
jgi:serine/threonine-protein phosphatase 2A regulatory subunit B'